MLNDKCIHEIHYHSDSFLLGTHAYTDIDNNQDILCMVHHFDKDCWHTHWYLH